nr:putative sigma factor [uncultured Mediterranean phage uvMED]BAR21328.1 putative sigma factor [uncultured Mediterranean phage uvMED]
MADSILRNPDGQFTSERARKDGRVCGRRQPDVVIEARRQKLYKRQLEGKTTRQLVLEHAATEGIGIETAWTDWRKVKSWNDEDWEKDREKMIGRLQGMRMKLFNQAMKKGQLQTAAQVLDSLGRVLGESVENININAPQLSISVEDKKK